MAIKVLVVDDSSFFRRRVSEIINAEARLEVIDVATNGKEAVEKALRLKPDVITMDIEMPVMDGITAVREIMAANPTPILMFSSLTQEGAKATLDALDAGALDFLPKKFEDIARNRDEAVSLLQQRVIQIAAKKSFMRRPMVSRPAVSPSTTASSTLNRTQPRTTATPSVRPAVVTTRFRASGKSYQLTAIGTSTGGPVALQKILTKLPANYPHPIVLVQHMPATFTAAFASRLNSLCKIQVKEAEDGDILRPGVAYLAPGGKQMMLEGRPGSAKLRILDGGERMNYKPCVDVTFGSAAKVYSDKVLSMILTGMGADGREGSRMLKTAGATIWAQDEESCVVYGMPQAVAKSGISSEDLPLDRIAERMLVEVGLAQGNSMIVWSVANQKGGVGKTTTTVTLAGLLSKQGKRVLLVDTDPHASLTTYLGFDSDGVPASLFDLFQLRELSEHNVKPLILKTVVEGIVLFAALMSLATLDRVMGNRSGMGLILKRALMVLRQHYDYVLIDCPPILGVMMVNALAASDRILIPVQTEFLAMKGLERMVRTLAIMQKSRSREFKVTIIPTMYDKRTRASLHTLTQLKKDYPDQVWSSAVPIDTKFRDASLKNLPASHFAEGSRGVFAYKQLLLYIERLAINEQQPIVVQ